MYDEAFAAFKKAMSLSGRDPQHAIGGLGHLYAVTGRKSEAQEQINELKQLSQQRYVRSAFIALIYAGLGDKDQAFAWLEKALDERDPAIVKIKIEPIYDNLRSDPRFTKLLQRINLTP